MLAPTITSRIKFIVGDGALDVPSVTGQDNLVLVLWYRFLLVMTGSHTENQRIIFAIFAISAHSTTPKAVGRITAAAVHFRLPVSFFMVRQVVEQGKWKRIKIMVQRAVTHVQPLSVRIVRITSVLSVSISIPAEV
jgi:hypothetical protein